MRNQLVQDLVHDPELLTLELLFIAALDTRLCV